MLPMFWVMERSEVLDRVEEAVEEVSRDSGIVAAYLYGSFVREEEDAQSDVDIGLVFRDYSLRKLLEASRRIDEEAETGRELDVRALNDAGPEFAFNVISEGEVVYESSASERADYEQMFERKYHDMKPYIQEYRQQMKERVSA